MRESYYEGYGMLVDLKCKRGVRKDHCMPTPHERTSYASFYRVDEGADSSPLQHELGQA